MLWKKKNQQQQQQQNLAFEVSRKTYFPCEQNLTAFNKVMGDVIVLGTMIIGFMGTSAVLVFALLLEEIMRRLYIHQITFQISYYVLCFRPIQAKTQDIITYLLNYFIK
jgi:hypothetical protein